MAEIPKLIQRQGSGKMTNMERTDSKKMPSENLMSGLNAKSDGFIVDLEAFSTHISAYSRITQLPRSLSRKGHHRGSGDSVTSFLVAAAACSSPSSSSSPKGEMGPSSIQEKAGGGGGSCSAVITVGPTNTIDREPENPNPQPNNNNNNNNNSNSNSNNNNNHNNNNHNNNNHNQHHHHQITVKTGGTIIPPAGAAPDTQMGGRRRSHLPWYSHPKRVLLFFATISSIGTLLLICFTLAINKPYTTSD